MGTKHTPSPLERALARLPRLVAAPLSPEFRQIFERSEPWDEVKAALQGNGAWWLIRDVPLALLGSAVPSVDGYATDGDQAGVDRCDAISQKLDEGESLWPLLISGGFILDGYHRLAVIADRGDRTVDVLWTSNNREILTSIS